MNDSSTFGLIPDGSDCFFNSLLGVLFWHVRHFCVHLVEKRQQTVPCLILSAGSGYFCFDTLYFIATDLCQELLIVADGHDGYDRDSSPLNDQMLLATVGSTDHVTKTILGLCSANGCDLHCHGPLGYC